MRFFHCINAVLVSFKARIATVLFFSSRIAVSALKYPCDETISQVGEVDTSETSLVRLKFGFLAFKNRSPECLFFFKCCIPAYVLILATSTESKYEMKSSNDIQNAPGPWFSRDKSLCLKFSNSYSSKDVLFNPNLICLILHP